MMKKIVAIILFLLIFGVVSAEISLDKETYAPGEIVNIKLGYDNLSDKKLTINTDSKLYSYNGHLLSELNFLPQEKGLHTVTFKNGDGTILGLEEFVVEEQKSAETNVPETTPSGEIIKVLEKNTYQVGEEVSIDLNEIEFTKLKIIFKDNVYSFLGEDKIAKFIPKEAGEYTLELTIGNVGFIEIFTAEGKEKVNLPVKKVVENNWNTVRLFKSDNKIKDVEARVIHTTVDNKRTLQIDFSSLNKIKNIKIKNLEPDSRLELGIEEDINELSVVGKRSLSSYSIDPTRMSFEEAEVTVTAVGTELWKCKDWNFTTQSCYGTWEKIMDITPGQEYTFLMTPLDPGFAETGVSLPTTFSDTGSIGTRMGDSYDNDTSTSGSIDIDANGDPTYVEFTTFDISTLDAASTLNQFNVTFLVETTGTFSNDNWYLEYSTDGGSGWTRALVSEASSAKLSYSYDVSFTGWTLQDFTDNFQARAGGDKDTNADGVSLLVYEVWVDLNFTAPTIPPTPLTVSKNTSSIYVNDSVEFNATWIDADGTLDSWIFSWNLTGSWENITSGSFGSGNLSNTTEIVNISEGTAVGWRFYANDTQGDWNSTAIQTFTVLGGDSTPPTISNEAVTPTTGGSGTKFNITANVYDAQTVQNVWGEVMTSDGTRTNYSMSVVSGTQYGLIFNSTYGGNLSFVIYASDGTNDNVSATRQYFNVTANITTDATYYGKGTIVTITGEGFTSGGTVDLNVQDENGASVSTGYSSSVTADENGSISTQWSISSSQTFIDGNYTITATDSSVSWLSDNEDVIVVIKPSTVMAHSDDSPNPTDSNALTKINDSDNVYANIVGSNAEVWLETNFSNVLPVGYIVNYAVIYFEHVEVSTDSTYVKWYNSTAGTYQTICTITNEATEVFTLCNLTGYVINSTSLNSLSIRFSDNNVANNNENWTMIDFVYLDIDFNVSYDLAVTINDPSVTQVTYDYNGANHEAYKGGNTVNPAPPATIVLGTEFTSEEYTNISASDNAHTHTAITGNTGEHAYQTFKFIVPDSEEDITSFVVTHEGYATETTDQIGDTYGLYLWNFTSGVYQLFTSGAAQTSDQTIIATINTNGSDFINTTGELYVLVEGDFKTVGSGGAQADLWTDYIKLDVNKVTAITGLQDVNATALDGDGVDSCTYFYTYTNGSFASDSFTMLNYTNNIWYNISNTNLYVDGFYYLYVNCTDSIGSSYANASIYVKIANAEPTVRLVNPTEYTNFTYSNINFTWNVTENGQGVPTCNLSIDGTVKSQNVPSTSGTDTTRNHTIVDGTHYWNVTCVDSSGVSNSSETWQFDVDTTAPVIILNSPNASDYINATNVMFYYTPSDAHIINNCTLIINQQVNQTNSSINNGTQNNFSITNFAEGIYNWSVNCTDNFDWTGTTTPRQFVVDRTEPSIQLNYPDPDISTASNVNFNWTVTDNLDGILLCNITVNNIVLANNINSPSNQATNYSLSLTDGVKYWNVTCWDNATNINFSDNRIFNVSGPPNVNLVSPTNNNWTNSSFLNFTFYTDDGNGIQNCSLYFDGTYNQTKPYNDITNFNNNTFNISNVVEGLHNWSVECYDNLSTNTQTSYWNVTVDYTKPSIGLSQPSPEQTLYSGNVDFNFTVMDNLDSNITCNLNIDGSVSAINNNFGAINNTVTNLSETGIGQGIHNWSVSCWDEIINYNTSETRNFTIDTGPTVNLYFPENNNKTTENVTYTFYAEDNAGIFNCSLLIDNKINDTLNYSDITNYVNNTFSVYNISSGLHNWTVECYDNNSQKTLANAYNFTVDTVLPVPVALNPNGTAFSTNNINFNFSVTDDLSLTLECNVSVDNGIYSSLISATNGSIKETTINSISGGTHYWNVTCWDEAGLPGYSDTLNFSIDTGPQVNLWQPADKTGDLDGNVTFTYKVSETNLQNCSLIFNNQINWTMNSTDIPYSDGIGLNNFTLENMPQGVYNWTVNCTDINGFVGTDTKRELHVDWEYPNVSLSYPLPNETIYLSTITFNWTAFDNVDPELLCNLSINGFVNVSNISSTNNQSKTQDVSGFTVGNYTWNVSCVDNAGFINYSETRNFSVSSDVRVTQVAPSNSSTDPDGSVTFTYIPESIAGFSGKFCDIHIDNIYNDTDVSPTVGAENSIVKTGVSEGNHTWFMNCTDASNNYGYSTNWTLYVDLTNPSVVLDYPDGETFATSTVNFNWTAYDNMDDVLVCNITIDDSVVATNVNSTNGTTTNYSISNINDSIHYWNVTCADNGGRGNYSLTNSFTIAEPPKVGLGEPAEGYRNSTTNRLLYYTATDNSGGINNCTLILNGADNQTNGSVNSGQEHNFSILNLADGTYTWDVNCTDPSFNAAINGTAKTFYVDLTPPNITLNEPTPADTFNLNNVSFNWTSTDFAGTTILCNLTIDGYVNVTNITGLSASDFTTQVNNLDVGIHFWNVTCADDLGNVNTSVTRNFSINQPDLFINNSRLSFSNSNPDLAENITIFANITNTGGSTANNVFVEFWDGLPGSGIYIGNDTRTVTVNASVVFNVSWIVTSGYHNIWVVVDPNDDIGELFETNNNATINISAIYVNITHPDNATLTNDSTPQIDFNITDFTGGTIDYDIYVDGSLNGQSDTVSDGSNTSINLTSLGDGTHIIIVQATDGIARLKNSTPLTITIDTTEPQTDFITANASWYNTVNVSITFNMTDATSENMTYKLYLDGSINSTGNATNGTAITENLTGLSEGTHIIIIEGMDNLTNVGNSTELTIYVDLTNPEPHIETANGTWFNTGTPTIDFNITDNMDPVLNYTFYVDKSINVNGTVNNGISDSAVLSALGNGTFIVEVEGLDEAGNRKNSTNITIFVDTVKPSIELHYPEDENITGGSSVYFNWTANDNLASTLECNLTIDGTNYANVNVTAGVGWNETESVTAGIHYWNVTCKDLAGNINTSVMRNFTVPAPDLYIDSGLISFNSSTPEEGKNLSINATIKNIGLTDAGAFTVQFYSGDPDFGGTQINGNITVASLAAGTNITVNTSHLPNLSINTVFVLVDVPLATNGVVSEVNESNNEANKSFDVIQFHIIAGDTIDELRITDPTYIKLFKWNQTNLTGSNIFVVDTDSNIGWFTLQAISRDTSNNSASNDFENIDDVFGSENYSDSINTTYTIGGSPKTTQTFSVFSTTILNVPIVNSTNTSDFVTGILWDYGDGNTQYNGTQDLIFITEVNENKTGLYGTYDYEIKIPAPLRSYKGTTNTVTFYTEIK
ncbi:MAG: CARDB domain-containing protein [archaeon]